MAGGKQVTVDQAYDIARTHQGQGNLSLADMTYRDILRAVPDHHPSLHMLGLISYQRGNPAEALYFIEQAIATGQDDAHMQNNYAIILSENGRHTDAITAWTRATALAPDYAEAYSNRANTHWQMGNHAEAEADCRRALSVTPDLADAWLNLGNALTGQGRIDDALAAWQSAVTHRPDFSLAWSNIGNALRDLGRLNDAEAHCRKAVTINARNVEGWNNLGNALRDLGRPAEAEGCYRKAILEQPGFARGHSNMAICLIDQDRMEDAALHAGYATAFDPHYAEGWTNLSIARRHLGDLDGAENAARRAVALQSDSAEGLIDLAAILMMTERVDEAEISLNRALTLKPNSVRIYIKLANVLERAQRMDESLDMLEKAIALSPEMSDLHLRKASLLFMLNRIEASRAAIDRAMTLQPDNPSAYALMSEIEQSHGNMNLAEAQLRTAIDLRPDVPFFYASLSKVKKFTRTDPDLTAMLDMVGTVKKFGVEQDIALHYALFKAYEDCGDIDSAFRHLKTGSDLKRSVVAYDRKATEQSVIDAKALYTPAFFEAAKGKGCTTNRPIFIVGMPRSGTTLTEQILSSHPDVFGAGELYDLTASEYDLGVLITPENAGKLGDIYAGRIEKINSAAKFVTDKMPGNFIRIGLIAAAMPNARIIHCRRDAVDTCLSCYKQIFARGQYWSYDLEDLGHFYNCYEDIMAYWRDVLPGRFYEINYEALVNDMENETRKLVDYTGTGWDDACLTPHLNKRSVLTASKAQVIQPVYKTSVESWRKYEDYIEPLIKMVAPEKINA